ncbi:MAG: glycosyltransferase family 4 protein [Chloroflexaceae bacterium]|nr:glycosyltransferase family 4 protein [Chloroflexaceae bacterium]
MKHAPLRIAQVVEATLAGVGRHVLDVTGGLLRQNQPAEPYDIHLLHSLRRADARYRARLQPLIPHIRVGDIRMEREIRPLADTRSVVALTRYLRQHGPFDVVHVHSSKAAAVGGVAARLAGARRIVYTPHAFVSAGTTGRRRAMYLALERVCGHLAHRVVAVSQDEYAYACTNRIVSSERLSVVPNRVELPDLNRHPADRARLRQEWGLAESTRLVGSIGRLSAQKDPLLFVEVAARRAQRYPSSEEQYVIVGDGELMPDVRAAIDRAGLHQRMIVAGFRTDMDAVYACLDVFVLHSRYEGMPYTVLEAMGHARPVVATRVSGIAELLGNNGNSLIVAPGSADELDAALEHLVDPGTRQESGHQHRARLEQHYPLEAMIDRLLEVYQGTGES